LKNELPPGGNGLRGMSAWIFAAIAFLPMLAIYVLHFAMAPTGSRGTGFLQADQVMYMAMAIRHFSDGFLPTYGLPYSPDPTTPRIYFQLPMLLLGTLQWLFGLDPGVVYMTVGIIAGTVMFRLALALLDQFHPGLHGWVGTLARVAFLWGGGLAVLTGLAWAAGDSRFFSYWWLREAAFRFDVDDGYWFLSLPRNVFFTVEAIYHCLFYATVLFLARKAYAAAFLFLVLTLLSHPFTGLELGVVVGGFLALEFFLGRDRPPWWLLGAVPTAVLAMVVYYAVLMSLWSPEHVSVLRQCTEDALFVVPWTTQVVAYGPVGIMAAWRLWRAPELLRERNTRLLLAWFAAAFALINHDLLVRPHQPAHFTRGYVWMPLALLALPVLRDGFTRLLAWRARFTGAALATALLGLCLLDNAAWFGRAYADLLLVGRFNTLQVLHADTEEAYRYLSRTDIRNRLLIADNIWFRYMASVYVPMRSWSAHSFASPDFKKRTEDVDAFFATGQEPEGWAGRDLAVVVQAQPPDPGLIARLEAAGFQARTRIGRYDILTRDASVRGR